MLRLEPPAQMRKHFIFVNTLKDFTSNLKPNTQFSNFTEHRKVTQHLHSGACSVLTAVITQILLQEENYWLKSFAISYF